MAIVIRIQTGFPILLVLLPVVCMAGEGGLSEELIGQIRTDFVMDLHTRAVYNSLTNNKVEDLALNHDLVSRHNEFFSHRVKVSGITDQQHSGRCWIFSALNSLRPGVLAKYKLEAFEFSQNYIAFWDKMEKANTFLQYMIDFRDRDLMDREVVLILEADPFLADGGYWENFSDLAKKYGLVPKEAMPETKSSGETQQMNQFLYQVLRSDVVALHKMHKDGRPIEDLIKEKERMLADVYRILVLNLGCPPAEFTWRYKPKKEEEQKDQGEDKKDTKNEDPTPDTTETDETVTITMTPKQFLKEFVGVDLDDYLNLFNDTIHPTGKHYQIRMSRNGYDGRDIRYVNVDLDTLKQIAIRSIQGGDAMLLAADVSYDQSKDLGIMAVGLFDYRPIYGVDVEMTKAQRALYRGSVRNHGMNLIGVDLQGDKPVKWLVENSWGEEAGSKGLWTLYDDWFDLHVYNIIVNKKYIPKEVQDIAQQPPVILPPWDPML